MVVVDGLLFVELVGVEGLGVVEGKEYMVVVEIEAEVEIGAGIVVVVVVVVDALV